MSTLKKKGKNRSKIEKFFTFWMYHHLHWGKMRRSRIIIRGILQVFAAAPIRICKKKRLLEARTSLVPAQEENASGVFGEAVPINHITVGWQRRNTQPSGTDLLWVSSRLLQPRSFSSACIPFQIHPRSLGSFHIRIRWGSLSLCPFYSDTRASAEERYCRGCRWFLPHCSHSLWAEKTGENWQRLPDLSKQKQKIRPVLANKCQLGFEILHENQMRRKPKVWVGEDIVKQWGDGGGRPGSNHEHTRFEEAVCHVLWRRLLATWARGSFVTQFCSWLLWK